MAEQEKLYFFTNDKPMTLKELKEEIESEGFEEVEVWEITAYKKVSVKRRVELDISEA